MATLTMKWTYDIDGDEVEVDLPAKYEVCGTCEGNGTHLNPSIGQHAYSSEEFYESFDEEEQEQYFKRGGMYDVQCEECNGKRVIAVPDFEMVWPKHETNPDEIDLKNYYKETERNRTRMAREEQHERDMGY